MAPIPRVIHQIWLNGEPPDTLKRLQERMMRANPGYELRVWTKETLPPLYNVKQFAEVEGWSYKCDVARYEILWRYAGIYVDWDVIFWRGFDDIFAAGMPDNFFVPQQDGQINNCLFGVGPGSPIAAALVQRLDLSRRMYRDAGGRAHQSGVPYFTRVVQSFPETAVVLPAATFHSGMEMRCAIKAASDPRYACLGCHFYNSMNLLETLDALMISGIPDIHPPHRQPEPAIFAPK